MADTATVTLLFCDIVESTALFARLGDDHGEEVQRSCLAALRRAVASHRGTEVKSIGDGLMVAFTSASQAVGCAVEMQRALTRMKRRYVDVELGLRVGLSMGDASVADGDWTGTPVVEAARLCALADKGQVLAADLVRAAAGTRGRHRFTTVGPLTLKGVPDPVPAVEVVWSTEGTAVPLPFCPIEPEQMPFVGREGEMARLVEQWERAREGRLQLAFVAGEPGIGKSRVSQEFAQLLHAQGATVLFGGCSEESLAPYQPFVQALRHYVLHCPAPDLEEQAGPDAAELCGLLPELCERLPNLPPPPPPAADGERYRLFEAVTSLLAGASAASPILLILDDLHWGDRDSMLLLRYLARTTQSCALLILGTYRDTDLTSTHPLADVLADMHREHRHHRIMLRGLSAQAVSSLLQAQAHTEAHQPALAQANAFWEETEGNPFFIEEILRHLVETKVAERRDGRWTVDISLDEIGIPQSVAEVIGRRLSRLSEEANHALTLAAVIGRAFHIDALERAGDLHGDDLIDALDEAVAARLIFEVPGRLGHLEFSHALIRETLYKKLSTIRRTRLHQLVGEGLEQLYAADPAPHLAELAHHFCEVAHAGMPDRALDYSVRAGDHAAGLLAYADAASHYGRALQVLALGDPPDEDHRGEVLIAYAGALRRAGELEKSQRAYERAAESARASGAADRLARAALGLGTGRGLALEAYETGGKIPHDLIRTLEDALGALPSGDSALRAMVLGRLATALYWTPGSEQRRASLGAEAVDMARRIGEHGALAATLTSRHYATWGPYNVNERATMAAEILGLAQQMGDRERELNARMLRMWNLLELGDTAAAFQEATAHDALAQELRQPTYLAHAAMFRALRARMNGRFAEAEACANQAYAIGERVDPHTATTTYGAQLIGIMREQGRLAGLADAMAAIIDVAEAMPAAQAHLALVYTETGRIDQARTVFERLAAHDFSDFPRENNFLAAGYALVMVCSTLDDASRATLLHDLLHPAVDRVVVVGPPPMDCYGTVAAMLGTLALTRGHVEEAAEYFEHADAIATRMATPPYAAEAQCGWATALLRRGRPGDREKALALLRRASGTARRLGMTRLSQRIASVGGTLLDPESANAPAVA